MNYTRSSNVVIDFPILGGKVVMELLGHVTRSIYFFKIVGIELITNSEYSVWSLKRKHGESDNNN